MDFVKNLPNSHGFEAISMVVDKLSKGAHFIPLRHPFMESSVAKIFIENVVKLHKISKSIVTNWDKNLISNFG